MTRPTSSHDIDRQHEEIKAAIGRLATGDLGRLGAGLHDLRERLQVHFTTEEAEDGFRHSVLGQAPRYITQIQRLFNEHDEILRRIEAIETKLQECLDGPVAEILADVAALRNLLHSHEERESRMVDDAMYHDTGFAG